MNSDALRQRLRGCYVTIPTLFSDPDLELNLAAMWRHVQFLLQGGLKEGNAVLLAGGAAGDFSTLTLDERFRTAEAVISAANGRVPVAVGAQTTSTRELVALAEGARRLGATFIQVSPPFYFAHTEDDFFEYVSAASRAAPDIGIIVYNTYWTSLGVSRSLVDRLLTLPNVVGLKWSAPDTGFMEFEAVVSRFADRVAIIDNQCRFVVSHLLGVRCLEVHICNHWPEWGVRFLGLLEERNYVAAQQELVRVVLPYMEFWSEMERFTSGDGYLDKLCMELVGLDSSRCRPPTRDVREKFCESARTMLLKCGTPRVAAVPDR
jgi:dihydrodipicolinate synthase/N-acetylneuraminate lyase